jgi:hypothetical protein
MSQPFRLKPYCTRQNETGHGITLLTELCTATEVDRQPAVLIALPKDPPMRTLDLAWRTSGREKDFSALGELIQTIRAHKRLRSVSREPLSSMTGTLSSL